MTKLRPILTQLAVTLWLSGCSSEEGQGIGSGELEGRSFALVSAVGFQEAAGSKVELFFREGEVGFTANCNGHSGPYQLRDSYLAVEQLGSTTKDCDTVLESQDAWLSSFVTSQPRVALVGKQLTLSGSAASLVFVEK